MEVCGYNEDSRLNEESNNKAVNFKCISPPIKSHLNISSLFSISACYDHTLWVTNENQGYAIGNNKNGQILGTQKKRPINKEELIELKDKRGHPCKIISAVCGCNYTLYLFSSPNSETNQIAYSHTGHNSGTPVFLNLNDHNPTHLFGGGFTAAVVDDRGMILYITSGDMREGNEDINFVSLPSDEKAVSIACCTSFVVAIDSTGLAYSADVPYANETKGKLKFVLLNDFQGIRIKEVSGIAGHCLAVCRDGRVFGRGSNDSGRLGLGKERPLINKFTEIPGLKHKIISASAGSFHSLFITQKGKVLGCGHNIYGEILTAEPSSIKFAPDEAHYSEDETQESKDETQESKDETQESKDEAQESKDETQESEDETQNSKNKTRKSKKKPAIVKPDFNVYAPAETTIKKDALFCIAGNSISLVFVGTEPPPYTPNRLIKENVKVAPDELYVKSEVKPVEAPEEQKVAQDETGAKEEPSGIDENVRVDLDDNEDELRLTPDDYGSGQ